MKTPMLRKILVAAMMLAFCGGAGAAGLGRLNVMSSLGQPLRAEVDVTASPEELETMVARLASAEAFKRANIDYLGAYGDVKLSVEKRTAGTVLRIVTTRPFNEPYVDLLIDLNWAGGRLLREFTFLLDPSERGVSAAPIAPAIAPVSTPAAKLQNSPAASVPRALPEKSVVSSARVEPKREAGDQYVVVRGDTLNKIVTEFKSDEVSQEQMLAAFYRANSDAFAEGNINRLRAGRILKIPQAEAASAIPHKEARQIVLKASNFGAYRQSVAAAAAAAPASESAAGQGRSGKIAPKVDEKAVAGPGTRDKVKLTPSEQGKSVVAENDAASKARVQALQDEVASRDKALKEANSRVADLEKNVRELQKLVELKNQGLADAQKQAADAKSASKASSSANESKPEATEPSASQSLQAAVITPDQSVPVLNSTPIPAVAESSPVVTPPKPVVQAPLVPVDDDGFLGTHIWALLGALGAIGVLGYVIAKQRRKHAAESAGNTQLTESSITSPNSVFGSAGGQTVDTGGTSLLHTDFSQSGMSAIDADEGVDPVAEADVYMAYGRDAQAEEILLDALKNDPARTAVYVKLLEVYAQRHELKSFENIATDLYSQSAGIGDDWAKASTLGLRLDPENPLYKMSGSASVEAGKPSIVQPLSTAAVVAPVVSFGTNNMSQAKSTWTMPGEINQYAEAEGELPMIVEAAPVSSIEPVPESLNLDFNLDLETPSSIDAPTEIETREEEAFEVEDALEAQPPFSEEGAPLEFDIGFDDEPSPGALLPAQSVPSISTVEADVEDFDLGIEASAEGGALAEVDLEKTNFESSLLDFDFELGEETNTKPTLDLSGVNLRSDGPQASYTATSLAASVVHEPIQDSIDVNEEVATKFELAKAYEEMGDMEGARELLEEVVSDGSESQKEQARAMLSRLS